MNLAREDLETAQLLLENQRYRACISRAYYAMYYATQALLIQHNLVSRSHKGMIQQFSQHFIKSGDLPLKMARDLRQAYDFRQLSDYEEAASINQKQAMQILTTSVEFVDQVGSFIEGID
ncbi:MAG: HEPN domain-containing protein [Leptolyngbya sp. SIO1D8]|nr:HEPN domain-containing protein [Leptolyngbya sp. SIO1D8]